MKQLFLVLFLCPVYVFATPVNINQADAQTISEALTGIGPKKADAIVQYRKEHGNFNTLEDLEKVSGVGEKTIKANEKDILFSDAPVPDVSDKKPAEQPDSVEQPKPLGQTKTGDVDKSPK